MSRTRTPQQQAEILCGALVISQLQADGLLSGGTFHVQLDYCYASLALLCASETVHRPSRALIVQAALGLLDEGAEIIEHDRPVIRRLLEHARLEWPG